MNGIANLWSMRFSGIFISVFLFISIHTRSQIIINEIMATNATSAIEIDYYNFPDWVEIYNNGLSQIDLSDYYLSDDPDDLKKWQFPSELLNVDQYYLVYCDKKDTGCHSNFGLSADGESVFLSDNAGNLLNSVSYQKQFPDISYGRDPSDINQWFYCSKPTPKGANTITTATEQSARVDYSVPAGGLTSQVMLNLTGENIKYTLNGADPKSYTTSYSQPININRTMVVKSRTWQDGYLPGETCANTYFLNEHTFTLPVVVLSFTPEYFYNNTIGIHVRGTNGIEGNCGSVANWNQNWERAAFLEYFDANGSKQISQPIGVKLAGGCTRGRDQKSLSLYARSKYGDNDFDYPFFIQKPEIIRYKSLLLRNSGNDQDQTLLRDAFLQSLVSRSMDLDYQSYQPVIVYFNDEYRGIMNLREKTDEDYFISNYAIGSDEVDFLEGILRAPDDEHCYTAIRGSLNDYKNIISYISDVSLSVDDNYKLVASRLDLQEYINYMTLEIYVANRDWPGNNLKFWKKSDDGKWRWIVFDLDYGFGFRLDENGYTNKTFDFVTEVSGPDHPNPPWSTLLFRRLLENDSFKKHFISTFITHVYSSFEPEWCNYVLDSLSVRIAYEIPFNQDKYGRTTTQWLQYLQTLRQYAVNRHNFMPGYVKSFFSLSSGEVTVNIVNPNVAKGKVSVNHALVQMYPFNMITWKELPLLMRAVPEKGYRFVRWNYANESVQYSDEIEIKSDTSFNIAIGPVFEPVDNIDGIYLNEIASTSSLFRDEKDEESGFVELYNSNTTEKVLFGFYISDDRNNLIRFAVPDSTVIPAGGFITYYLDGEARQGELHASFRADPDGETFYLSQKSGEDLQIKDSLSFAYLVEDHSFGRYADGSLSLQYMVSMTPGSANDGARLMKLNKIDEISYQIKIYPNPSEGEIYVTFDENNPDPGQYYLDVTDITGYTVYPKIWLNSTLNHLNLSNLSDGFYIVRVYYGTKVVHAAKLIITN